MARRWLPFAIGAGVLLAAGAAWAFAGDDAAGTGDEVVPPQTADEIEAARVMMCTCLRGGASSQTELVACTLGQVYQGVDWDSLMQAPLDKLTEATKTTVALFSQWASELLGLETESQRQAWCGEPVEPIIVEPVFPEDPDPVTPVDPGIGGPPKTPGGAKPKPGVPEPTSPPDAPRFDPNDVYAEAPAVDAVISKHRLGQLTKPSGQSLLDFLTDEAYEIAYGPNAPEIPRGWDKGEAGIHPGAPFGWSPWVTAWKRLQGMVRDQLE